MVLKIEVPLVREIMTGAILGGSVELRVPPGKSDEWGIVSCIKTCHIVLMI